MIFGRRHFIRRTEVREYRKRFLLATEGKTEQQYFNWFKRQYDSVLIKFAPQKNSESAPQHVLKRMESFLKEESLENIDEAWLVVDKDQWTDEQLMLLHKWSQTRKNRYLALSNPKFEFWLLLHFEDGKEIRNSNDCSRRLKQYLPDYDKDIKENKISLEGIKNAIDRAKKYDNPPCDDWPRKTGSTVYRLVENILKDSIDITKSS